jgi:hypothetical protein
MEPQENLNTHARQIGRGKPFPKYLEHNAGINPRPTLNIQLWESSNDVATNAISVLL